MSEEKNSNFKIEPNTTSISFEEAMGITPTVTLIELSNDIAAAKADIEISEQVESNQENGQSFSWDYVPSEDLLEVVNLDETKVIVSSGTAWRFSLIDLLDEDYRENQSREKTAPNSLVNSFENRDPRLGTLSQIKSD